MKWDKRRALDKETTSTASDVRKKVNQARTVLFASPVPNK